MDQRKQDFDRALDVIKSWDWKGYGPDDEEHVLFQELGWVVNHLALEGIANPADAVLALLSEGKLVASGSYRWEKYQGANHYSMGDEHALIKQTLWNGLRLAIARDAEASAFGVATPRKHNLFALDVKQCLTHEWAPETNEFSFSSISAHRDFMAEDYYEEWCSVWALQVSLPVAASISSSESLLADAAPKRGGGRPPANWWPDFAEELAVYVHVCGMPEGEEHGGQSAVIDAICERLTLAGKAEPTRSTVQPVVNRVLKRIRSAEN